MTRKRVCILTFHNSRNYGAVLQAYALQKKMGEIFEIVEILDYRNEKIEHELRLWTCKDFTIKEFVRAIFALIFRLHKKVAFEKYMHRYMKISKRVQREDLLMSSLPYDIFVTGSDQVWNTVLTGNDETFFLDFVEQDKCKIAFAASFGDGQAVIDNRKECLLRKFQLITLREDKACKIVEEALGESIKVCCDPTLLLESVKWKEVAACRLKRNKYVFLFMIDDSRQLIEYTRKLAKEKGMCIVSNKRCLSFLRHISPRDFVSWVLYADYVVTNSFHGTVFSLLFEKRFVSHRFTEEGKPKVRIMELLDKVSLGHRVTDNAGLDIDVQEDWDAVGHKLSQMRLESWRFMSDWFEQNVGGNENGGENQGVAIS